MASPIAHSFAGFWTSLALRGRSKTRLTADWRYHLSRLGVLIILANAADLDLFLPPGFPNNILHRGFTHSLTVAIVVSLGLSCLWRIVPGFWRSAILYFTAYGSHLLIDLVTGTKIGWTRTGFGIQLFWPWPEDFSSPFILFLGIRHKDVAALFSLDNLWACIYETLTCGLITVVGFVLWKRKLKSRILGKPKLNSRKNRPRSEAPPHLLSNLQYQEREASRQLPKLQDQE
jgi:membrane-bound metal-dependent hydrolase YbcI (DUF457 family)